MHRGTWISVAVCSGSLVRSLPSRNSLGTVGDEVKGQMRILKVVGIILVVVICLAVIAFAFALPTLEQKAREEVITQLQEKLDAKVELKVAKLSSLWPLGLRFQDFRIIPQNGQYRVDV